MKKIIIAIDGPAASGKTTTAKIVAETLGYLFLDTGAMYRAIALAALREGIESDEAKIETLIKNIKIDVKPSGTGQLTFLNGEDISLAIREPEVTKWSSPISAYRAVREAMVDLQRQIGKDGGIIVDGRDIGTTVFPDAELKFYVVASVVERAKRRTKELNAAGKNVTFDEIRNELLERDKRDSSREISPLKKADDAIVLDTSEMTIQEQSQLIIEKAKEIIYN